MATYEIEHSISTQPTSQPRPNRFDFTDFFSTIDSVDTRTSHTNPHALPTPPDVSGVFRSLAESFERYRLAREREGQEEGHSEEPPALLTDLISQLLNEADMPPKEVKGVPDGYMDELERVDKKSLKKDDTCPICGIAFLDDPYPLVVCLPCHPAHRFDLDCIAPWLKLHATCPLDRKNLLKKKEIPPPADDEEEEEDYDMMFG